MIEIVMGIDDVKREYKQLSYAVYAQGLDYEYVNATKWPEEYKGFSYPVMWVPVGVVTDENL